MHGSQRVLPDPQEQLARCLAEAPLGKTGDPAQQDRSNERTALAHLRHPSAMHYLTLLVHEHTHHTVGSSTYVSTAHAQQSDNVLHKVATSHEAST